jgi:hypothetical protein
MFDPESDKGEYCFFTSTESVASLVSASDDAANSSFVALNVFEDGDTSDVPVFHYYRVEDIAFAAASTNSSWVWLSQGGNRMKKILVYHDLDAILNLADTGTTTQWLS